MPNVLKSLGIPKLFDTYRKRGKLTIFPTTQDRGRKVDTPTFLRRLANWCEQSARIGAEVNWTMPFASKKIVVIICWRRELTEEEKSGLFHNGADKADS
jgi:hypothetical protein